MLGEKEPGEDLKAFIDVIHHPDEIEKRYHSLIVSAQRQIILFLPTITAFRREEKIGIFESLEMAADRGVDIKILVPIDEQIQQKINQKIKKIKNFEIRKMNATVIPVEARTKILIVDKNEYLVMELKDDSKELFIEAVGSAIFSNSKSTVLSYLTMFDSLWRQTELYEKLESHDKMQKEFINIAAHELRTPTQSILGYSELLQVASPEEAGVMLESLMRNAYRLQRLVTDILDVARIEAGTLYLEREKIRLQDLIFPTIDETKNQIKANGKMIKILYSTVGNQEEAKKQNSLTVYADKERIIQVLTNLLHNALKFTKEGSINILTERKDNNEVIISVKDSGSGIDSRIIPRLFEKFASKSEKGTGLGLYISKNIVEAHGGKIWASNNSDGKGATFSFSLPITSFAEV